MLTGHWREKVALSFLYVLALQLDDFLTPVFQYHRNLILTVPRMQNKNPDDEYHWLSAPMEDR